MESFFLWQLTIEGIAPEGALLHFRREKIPVFHVEKPDKRTLRLCIERKNREKVFTFLRDSCYNVTKMRPFGLWRLASALRRRAGFFLGAVAFALLCAVSDFFVFRIDVTGSGAYYRDKVLALLQENGVRAGCIYRGEKTAEITAQILSFDNVSFCSLEKTGSVLTVEVQTSSSLPPAAAGGLYATEGGVVQSLTVVRGVAQVQEGDEVEKGQLLADGKDGGIVMASARILCHAERFVATQNEETAAAQVILSVQAVGETELLWLSAKPQQDGYFVTAEYILTVRRNMD